MVGLFEWLPWILIRLWSFTFLVHEILEILSHFCDECSHKVCTVSYQSIISGARTDTYRGCGEAEYIKDIVNENDDAIWNFNNPKRVRLCNMFPRCWTLLVLTSYEVSLGGCFHIKTKWFANQISDYSLTYCNLAVFLFLMKIWL